MRIMNVTVNGETRSVVKDSSIAGLLIELELAEKRIAVELNGDIVPAALFSKTWLVDGDRVEIVQAIGGG